MKKIIALLIILIFAAPLAYASSDVHVNSLTGTDSGTCGSVLTPCKTVKQAVTNAGSGSSVVKIAAGDYSESIQISSSVAGLTLQGGWSADFSAQDCDPDQTVLTSTDSILMSIHSDALESVSVNAYCITFQGSTDNHGIGIFLASNHGILSFNLENCIIDRFAGQGMYLHSSNNATMDVQIDKTIFKNAYSPDSSPTYGAGLNSQAFSNSTQTVTLKNCLLFNNEGEKGSTIYVVSNDANTSTSVFLNNVTLTNNRSIGNELGAGIYIASTDSAHTEIDITNSIVWGNTDDGTARDIHITQLGSATSTVSSRYSIIGEIINSNATYNDNGHNLNLNPRLNSSYHLTTGSPAINAAQCGYKTFIYHRVAPYDDIDGDMRPGYDKLTGCDIGSDEFIDNSLCFPVKSHNGKVAIICM